MKISLGLSGYGMFDPGFPVRRFLRCFPKDLEFPCIAVLYGTFGDDPTGIKAFCKMFADRKHLIEIHISNECARRTHRAGKQIYRNLNVSEYQNKLENINSLVRAVVRQRVETVLALVAPYINSNTIITISPGLESDLHGVALDNLHRMALRMSRKKIVYSANGHADGLHGANFLESHSVHPSPLCAYWNNDGTSIAYHDGEDFSPTIQMSTYLDSFRANWQTKKAVFLWDAKSQGLDGVSLSNPIGYDNRNFEVTDNAIFYKRDMLSKMQAIVKGG